MSTLILSHPVSTHDKLRVCLSISSIFTIQFSRWLLYFSSLEVSRSCNERLYLICRKIRHTLQNFNLFKRRNSDASAVREQILSTRVYVGCLFISTIILVLAAGLDEQPIITKVLFPSITEFERLFLAERQTLSCPCSQIAIRNSIFLSLKSIFHQICSSELLSEDSLDRLSYIDQPRSSYYRLDIRLFGLDMFRALVSFCELSNTTINDALTSFLDTSFISTEILS